MVRIHNYSPPIEKIENSDLFTGDGRDYEDLYTKIDGGFLINDTITWSIKQEYNYEDYSEDQYFWMAEFNIETKTYKFTKLTDSPLFIDSDGSEGLISVFYLHGFDENYIYFHAHDNTNEETHIGKLDRSDFSIDNKIITSFEYGYQTSPLYVNGSSGDYLYSRIPDSDGNNNVVGKFDKADFSLIKKYPLPLYAFTYIPDTNDLILENRDIPDDVRGTHTFQCYTNNDTLKWETEAFYDPDMDNHEILNWKNTIYYVLYRNKSINDGPTQIHLINQNTGDIEASEEFDETFYGDPIIQGNIFYVRGGDTTNDYRIRFFIDLNNLKILKKITFIPDGSNSRNILPYKSPMIKNERVYGLGQADIYKYPSVDEDTSQTLFQVPSNMEMLLSDPTKEIRKNQTKMGGFSHRKTIY